MTLDYGNYGIFLMMGNAGFISSTVSLSMAAPLHARTREDDCQHADGGRSGCIEAVDACQYSRRFTFRALGLGTLV